MSFKFFLIVILGLISLYFAQGSSINDKLFSSYLEVTSQSKSLGIYKAYSNDNKIIGSDNIKGEVKINGEAYTAICDCSGLYNWFSLDNDVN